MEQHIHEVMYHLNDTDLKLISSDKLNSKGMVVKPRLSPEWFVSGAISMEVFLMCFYNLIKQLI